MIQLQRIFSKLPYFLTTQKQTVYKFQYGIFNKHHPAKSISGGDDYSFASENLIAVADGVGAWNQTMPQPSIYSEKIIQIIKRAYENQKQRTISHPKQIVEQAVKLNKLIGSTTLTILTLCPHTGLVRTYYIGDSIYGIFKQFQVQMVQQQMVSFNRPYQIGTFGHKASDGYEGQYQLQQFKNQNMIVVGTDGLWDNLKIDRIHFQVKGPNSTNKQTKQKKTLQEICESLVEVAYKYSVAGGYESPFYLKALKQGKKFPRQGKLDDITAVVCKIYKEQKKASGKQRKQNPIA